MGDKNIEATVPRIFYVNNAAVRRPVGTFGESFRGEFVMITCGKETRGTSTASNTILSTPAR